MPKCLLCLIGTNIWPRRRVCVALLLVDYHGYAAEE